MNNGCCNLLKIAFTMMLVLPSLAIAAVFDHSIDVTPEWWAVGRPSGDKYLREVHTRIMAALLPMTYFLFFFKEIRNEILGEISNDEQFWAFLAAPFFCWIFSFIGALFLFILIGATTYAITGVVYEVDISLLYLSLLMLFVVFIVVSAFRQIPQVNLGLNISGVLGWLVYIVQIIGFLFTLLQLFEMLPI